MLYQINIFCIIHVDKYSYIFSSSSSAWINGMLLQSLFTAGIKLNAQYNLWGEEM